MLEREGESSNATCACKRGARVCACGRRTRNKEQQRHLSSEQWELFSSHGWHAFYKRKNHTWRHAIGGSTRGTVMQCCAWLRIPLCVLYLVGLLGQISWSSSTFSQIYDATQKALQALDLAG